MQDFKIFATPILHLSNDLKEKAENPPRGKRVGATKTDEPMGTRRMMLCAAIGFYFVCWLGGGVRAQGVADEVEPKWEVGTDLLNPFRKVGINPLTSTYGIILKRKHNETGAFRLRTNLASTHGFDPLTKEEKIQFTTVAFNVGYEISHRYDRLQHYYGVDLSQRYYKSNYIIGFGLSGPNIDPDNTIYTKSTSNRQQYGLGIFNGLKYYLAERVSLSIESTFNVYHTALTSTDQEISGRGTPIGPILNSYYPNTFRVTFTPVSAIYLSYYF